VKAALEAGVALPSQGERLVVAKKGAAVPDRTGFGDQVPQPGFQLNKIFNRSHRFLLEIAIQTRMNGRKSVTQHNQLPHKTHEPKIGPSFQAPAPFASVIKSRALVPSQTWAIRPGEQLLHIVGPPAAASANPDRTGESSRSAQPTDRSPVQLQRPLQVRDRQQRWPLALLIHHRSSIHRHPPVAGSAQRERPPAAQALVKTQYGCG
jgi:hypothetical protein